VSAGHLRSEGWPRVSAGQIVVNQLTAARREPGHHRCRRRLPWFTERPSHAYPSYCPAPRVDESNIRPVSTRPLNYVCLLSIFHTAASMSSIVVDRPSYETDCACANASPSSTDAFYTAAVASFCSSTAIRLTALFIYPQYVLDLVSSAAYSLYHSSSYLV